MKNIVMDHGIITLSSLTGGSSGGVCGGVGGGCNGPLFNPAVPAVSGIGAVKL